MLINLNLTLFKCFIHANLNVKRQVNFCVVRLFASHDSSVQ